MSRSRGLKPPKGATVKLPICRFIAQVFEANEILPKGRKLTDEQIKKEILEQFPYHASSRRLAAGKIDVGYWRSQYNSGFLTMGKGTKTKRNPIRPKVLSNRYDKEGRIVVSVRPGAARRVRLDQLPPPPSDREIIAQMLDADRDAIRQAGQAEAGPISGKKRDFDHAQKKKWDEEGGERLTPMRQQILRQRIKAGTPRGRHERKRSLKRGRREAKRAGKHGMGAEVPGQVPGDGPGADAEGGMDAGAV